jgi:hypothetical protein
MNAQQFVIVVLVIVAVVVYVFDGRMQRKAKNVRTSWNCIRCGVQLGPMESTMIRVAGGPEGPGTLARACQRCAKRDKHIWWTVMALIAAGFVTTVLLLRLNEG